MSLFRFDLMVSIQFVKFLHLFRQTFLSLQVTELNADLCVSKGKNLASRQGSRLHCTNSVHPGRSLRIQYENTEVNYFHKTFYYYWSLSMYLFIVVATSVRYCALLHPRFNVVERLIGKSSLTFSTLCWWKSNVCRWPVGAIVRIKLKIE